MTMMEKMTIMMITRGRKGSSSKTGDSFHDDSIDEYGHDNDDSDDGKDDNT